MLSCISDSLYVSSIRKLRFRFYSNIFEYLIVMLALFLDTNFPHDLRFTDARTMQITYCTLLENDLRKQEYVMLPTIN